jgi:hypothetical protein
MQDNYLVLNLDDNDYTIKLASVEAAKIYCKILRENHYILDAIGVEKIIKKREIELQNFKKVKEVQDLHIYEDDNKRFLRKLPKDAVNLRLVHSDVLSKKTKENLAALKEKYNVKWLYYHRYDIVRSIDQLAHGYIITGEVNNGNRVNYFRTETKHPVAGRTNLYFNKHNIQVCVLLDPEHYTSPPRSNYQSHNKKYQQFLKFLK